MVRVHCLCFDSIILANHSSIRWLLASQARIAIQSIAAGMDRNVDSPRAGDFSLALSYAVRKLMELGCRGGILSLRIFALLSIDAKFHWKTGRWCS